MFEYMTVQEAASQWNISARRVQVLCRNGQLSGAIKAGKSWLIPKSCTKPEDQRIRSGDYIGWRKKYRKENTERIANKEPVHDALRIDGALWERVPVRRLNIEDLDQNAIRIFKEKAVESGRLSKEEVSVNDSMLMKKLMLVDEDGYLIRAGMLAFYDNPERFVTGSGIRIGYFEASDADLRFQDLIQGPLINQVDQAVDLVYLKYMKGLIYYDGIQRVEQYMFPKKAFRELLLNAVIHKDYASSNPIQISVYPDHFCIFNAGSLPEDLKSAARLYQKHASIPYNPRLARVFFLSGMVETWGRGFEVIKTACEDWNCPLPEYMSTGGVMFTGKACPKYLELLYQ